MTEDREHLGDALAALALGSIDEVERGRVQKHIDTCDTCAERLMEFRAVVGALPLTLPYVSPPPEAWTTIQTAAQRRGTPAWRPTVRSGWIRVARWSAAAALAGGLLVWNVSLQREVWRYAEGPQVEKLARRPGRLIILAGTSRPQASARLFAAVDGRSGHMAVSGLSPLPTGRVYRLWFLRSAGPPATAATFTVDADGRAWVVVAVPGPLEETRAIIVTEEPESRTPEPTGLPLLEAHHWR